MLECGRRRDPPRSRPIRPVTSLAVNHVHFNVQNPAADSTGWSPQVDILTFSAATERSVVTSDNAITEDRL